MKTSSPRKPITLQVNGKQIELWGLVKLAKDRRFQWKCDFDYIDKLTHLLNSSDQSRVDEATQALLFLNAAAIAEYEGTFKALEDLGIELTPTFKKIINDSRNAVRRDLITDGLIGAFEESADIPSLGDLHETMKYQKKMLRKQGRSVKELYENNQVKNNEPKPLPVKIFNEVELAALKEQRKITRPAVDDLEDTTVIDASASVKIRTSRKTK